MEEIYQADIRKIQEIEAKLRQKQTKTNENASGLSIAQDSLNDLEESRRKLNRERIMLKRTKTGLISRLQGLNLIKISNDEDLGLLFTQLDLGYTIGVSSPYTRRSKTSSHFRGRTIVGGTTRSGKQKKFTSLDEFFSVYENRIGQSRMTITSEGIDLSACIRNHGRSRNTAENAKFHFNYLSPINPLLIIGMIISESDWDNIEQFNRGYLNMVTIKEPSLVKPEAEDLDRINQELNMQLISQLPNEMSDLKRSYEKLTQEESEIVSRTQRIEEEISSYESILQGIDRNVSSSIVFLERYKQLMTREDPVGISKHQGCYTICLGESNQVFRYDCENLTSLTAGKKSEPFSISEYSLSNPGIIRGIDLGLIGSGDFIASDGIKLYGEAQSYAQNLFFLAKNGIRIFPPRRIGEKYRIDPSQKQKLEELVFPRTWGQAIIEKQKPDNVLFGQFFASGEYCRAYVFGDNVLVESSISDRATYVLKSEKFEDLRFMSRSLLRDEKPDGFVDRIIHPGDREDLRQGWLERITPYFSK